jgi:hypothetical protein
LDQGGNRVTWSVYCDAPLEREGFIEKLRTEQLDEARFKHKYGPGEYRVVGRTQEGHYVKGSHKVIKISGILAEPHSGGNDTVALLRELRADEDKARQQRADSAKSYATILAAPLATLGAALIARRPSLDVPALIAALRPQQSSLTEMTTALSNLRQMEQHGGGGNVELVLKLLERLQELPSGGGGETGWVGIIRDVIREAAPAAREMLGQLGQPRAQLPPGPTVVFPPQPVSLPRSNGATPNNSASGPLPVSPTAAQSATPMPTGSPSQPVASSTAATTESTDMDFWKAVEPWLRRKAEDLHESAAGNMTVELCAEHLLEAAEKKFGFFLTPEELRGFLMRPEWWQYVVAFHPPLEPFQAWVNDVRVEIINMLEEATDKAGRKRGTDDEPSPPGLEEKSGRN